MSITAAQIFTSLLAILALFPAMVCTGYVFAWLTNLLEFRSRSFVERLFWSIPLSIAISAIGAQLLGRYTSLTIVALVFAVAAACWIILLAMEWRDSSPVVMRRRFGWGPYARTATILALVWIVIVVLSLVDIEHGRKLYMSVTVYDQAYRVSWIQSVQRTGIPPMNALYFFQDPSPLRTFYFWYVVCAAGARLMHIPARAALIASSVWVGFALASIIGLYLKYWLNAGSRLRKQFILAISLMGVTGLDLLALFFADKGIPADLEWWSHGSINSWADSLLWVPHHVASLVCCMFALLVASLAKQASHRSRMAGVAVISMALASAFGTSIFVCFAFFALSVAWTVWHIAFKRRPESVIDLLAGWFCAAVLLAPFLRELAKNKSGNGQTVFSIAVREMFPPDAVLTWPFIHNFALNHPVGGRNLANLFLLIPGYIFELGFFLIVLVTYWVIALKGRRQLSDGHKSLLFLATATLPLISFCRSGVLQTNDFGWRAALLLQFPLLLLGSEWLMDWMSKSSERDPRLSSPSPIRKWLRPLGAYALIIGIAGTAWQVLWLRFYIPIADRQLDEAIDPKTRSLARDAYMAWVGYRELDTKIRSDAIVQYNPHNPDWIGIDVDMLNIDRQVAMFKDNTFKDQLECGSVWGGNPEGCRGMENSIGLVYQQGTAEQARETCRRFGIEYLVARPYDPVWSETQSWVWKLPTVVSTDGFRAFDCRH